MVGRAIPRVCLPISSAETHQKSASLEGPSKEADWLARFTLTFGPGREKNDLISAFSFEFTCRMLRRRKQAK